MYWFSENIEEDRPLQEVNWELLPKKRRTLAQLDLTVILEVLDGFSREWNESGALFQKALKDLILEGQFSPEETKETLKLLPELLKRSNLERRIKAEFGRIEVLDRFSKLPNQMALVKATPNGPLLHVTAGNVFLSSIDSLIMGFVTKNVSLLKVSHQNRFFPLCFAEALRAFDTKKILADKFAVLYWKGGDKKTESFVKSKVNTILAWGGEEMIRSYQTDLPLHVKLIDHGPKISLQIISKSGLASKNLHKVAQHIVADIIPWDQSACASPQNLYIQEGINEKDLFKAINDAFNIAPRRGKISEDEATEILKEKFRGLYSQLIEGGRVFEGNEHLIHQEESRVLRPSPLHRSLIIKRFKDNQELYEHLVPFSYYLQSCSYLLAENEKDIYLNDLSLTGIKRFAPLGTITIGMEGAPHDGRFVLRELVNFIGDEQRAVNYGEDVHECENSQTIKSHFEKTPHPHGYIFSSGGTTGEPKFVHFSYEEFDTMSDMLAQNLSVQGVKSGMTVANLFVAGNLWSSYMCIEKALEKIGAIQLPIGGMCSNENILMYLKKFKPDVVMGIPSMLVMNAEFCENQKENLTIPMIFYAGEALSEARQEYLKRIWNIHTFGSAGYASVDAGVIGYQCEYAKPGEHHVFSDYIDLKILEEEAVVTSYARHSMPIKNYRTGDKIEWVSGDCRCGRKDPKFKLLGRIDNVIQIWSCRLLVSDVESVLSESDILTFQLTIHEQREANLVREKLTLSYEKPSSVPDPEDLLMAIYERSRDVRDTLKFFEFKKDIELKVYESGQLPRNARTGKISLIQDLRK